MSYTVAMRARKLTCPRHHGYNPAIGGQAAIRAGCPMCYQIWAVAEAMRGIEVRVREFEQDKELYRSRNDAA